MKQFFSNSLNPDRYRRRVRRQSVLGNRCLLFVRGLASTVCLGLGVARLRPTEQDSLVILRRGRRDPGRLRSQARLHPCRRTRPIV